MIIHSSWLRIYLTGSARYEDVADVTFNFRTSREKLQGIVVIPFDRDARSYSQYHHSHDRRAYGEME